jgi:hypothetical protein
MRHLSLAASALAVGTAVIYVGFLIKQGPPFFPVATGVVTGALVALGVLTAYGSLGHDPARRALALWAAVPGFFGLGVAAIWSIGGLLLIGGILTLPGAIAALRGIDLRLPAALGWALVILLCWGAVLIGLFMGVFSEPV